MAAPDPAIAAAASRRLARAASVLGGLFILTIAVLWFLREPAPSPRAAGPVHDAFASRRVAPPAVGEPEAEAGAQPEGMDRPFLDAAGAGSTAYAAGDYAAALAQYQAAVEKNPQDAESLSNLGQILVRLNRPGEAIPFFQRASAILPGRWAYTFNLARAFGLVGRLDESVAEYRRAQELFPGDYVTTFNLALALHKKGDEAGAVAQYEKAISLQPEDASFRMALAISYDRLQRTAEAADAYQEYLRLAPSAPDADKVRARLAQMRAPAGPDAAPAPSGGPAGQ